jgi:hypothetical protein
MKRVTCLAVGLILFAAFAAAQAPTAGQKRGLAASMQTADATLKGNMTQAAEKMPGGSYSFKPGSDPELRTAMLSHGLESYGIVVVYLRANGVAPPAAGGGGRGGRGGQ